MRSVYALSCNRAALPVQCYSTTLYYLVVISCLCEVRFVPSVFVLSSVDTIISLVRYDGLSYVRIRIGNATGKRVHHEIVLFSK